jgi:hypothetical protein
VSYQLDHAPTGSSHSNCTYVGNRNEVHQTVVAAWHVGICQILGPEVDRAAKASIHADFDFSSKNRFLAGAKVEYLAGARFRFGKAGQVCIIDIKQIAFRGRQADDAATQHLDDQPFREESSSEMDAPVLGSLAIQK